uniref:EGF-like domain-containing protein n=1 Tax=Sinocyclocheilus anshuiensis TaxID=1608454 RepID=A0A671NC53_9TELE
MLTTYLLLFVSFSHFLSAVTNFSLCRCHYGWKGDLCDECETFPGCDHGTCTEPWKCVCDTNWGGLLCDKAVNACDSNPCVNGGQCVERQGGRGMFCSCPLGYTGTYCEVRSCCFFFTSLSSSFS